MADDGALSLTGLTPDEKIVAVAKQRFQRCQTWESTPQARFVDDLKFANADPDNGYQWPNYLWTQRRDDPAGYKPRLTINKVRQHNLQIINDAKQNKPGVHIRPVGGDATVEAAQVWEGLVRHIERVSKAEQAYDTATSFQVKGGIGYIRLTTQYVDDDTFDQELRIQRVKNPLNCFLDPDHNEVDGSDSNFAFIFEDQSRDEFEAEYPDMKDSLATSALGNDFQNSWVDKDHVRIVEYFMRKLTRDKLVLMRDPQDGNKEIIARWSKVPKAIRDLISEDTIIKSREIVDHEIQWYKIAGGEIIDKSTWPGRYIPLVPVIGEEEIIEGKLDRKGHTRNLKDAQRMYNFWTSSAVEQVALQTKTKWFVPVGATENLESYYATLNTQNYPFIPWNAFDTDGNVLPAPVPIEPPTMAEGFIKGMMVSQNELMMASGQFQSQFGQAENATSGKAIAERQRQGDNATYHFIDGLAIAIRQVGNIILDVAPHIYDTKQIKRILAEDGVETIVEIDPDSKVAYMEQPKTNREDPVRAIFNPKIGRYWVTSDVGPSYATKRQEAWNAFVQITAQNKDIIKLVGDLMFRNADFPGALDIAERLKRIVPPEVLGEGPEPNLVAAQKQLEELKSLLAEALTKQAESELALGNKDRENAARDYHNETERLKEAGNAESNLDPAAIKKVVQQLLDDMGITTNGQATKSPSESTAASDAAVAPPAAPSATETPPEATTGTSEASVPGAKLAPDGFWYVPDPQRPGKFMQVTSGEQVG